MSDVSQGSGWWQASDGKWYPPTDATQAPAPGWWMASDGKWYPPIEQEKAPAPGWWMAADGNWYPPERKPGVTGTATAPTAAAAPAAPAATPAAPKPAPAPAKAATPKPAATPASAPAGNAGGTATAGAAKKAAAPKPATAKPAGTAKPSGAAKPAAKATLDGPPPKLPADVVERSRPIGHALSPEEQIRIRNEQSRQDAVTLAGARRLAATRALGSLQGLIEQEKQAQKEPVLREARPQPTAPANGPATATPTTTAAPASAPAASAPPASPVPASAPAAATTSAVSGGTGRPAPEPAATAPTSAGPPEAPLLEVKQGTLAADLDRLGERLVIFNDRVELHDRNDRVRQVIGGPDITDVVVHKKFTGSTVTVESASGEAIIAKGLKPDQADEIRALILKGPRQLAPGGAAPAAPTAPAATATASPTAATPATPAPVAPKPVAPKPAPPKAVAPKPVPPKPAPAKPADEAPAEIDLQEAELVAKLTDLHKAGVLTDDELEEKKALVARLARGGSLATSPT